MCGKVKRIKIIDWNEYYLKSNKIDHHFKYKFKYEKIITIRGGSRIHWHFTHAFRDSTCRDTIG